MNTIIRGGKSVVWWMNTIIRGGKSVVWWMNTILGGSHSFRKRKDVPSAKVVHFFEICKYLGNFYAILEDFYQQKRQKLRETTKVAENDKGSGKRQRRRETTKVAGNDKGSGKRQRQRKTTKAAGNDNDSGKRLRLRETTKVAEKHQRQREAAFDDSSLVSERG